jgi:hypothetical protein
MKQKSVCNFNYLLFYMKITGFLFVVLTNQLPMVLIEPLKLTQLIVTVFQNSYDSFSLSLLKKKS